MVYYTGSHSKISTSFKSRIMIYNIICKQFTPSQLPTYYYEQHLYFSLKHAAINAWNLFIHTYPPSNQNSGY